MLQSVYRDVLSILSLLATTRLLLAGVRFAHRRFDLAPETPRKLLHSGMALILLPLPWLFSTLWPVAVLCAAFVALLVARRFMPALDRHVSDLIYGVDRRSIGEFLFPVVIFSLFAMTPNDPAGYTAAVLVLGFADAAAALVGHRFGLCRYPAPGGRKSVEGSLAMAAVAGLCVFASLSFFGDPRLPTVPRALIAISIAVAAALVEAFCTHGLDNALVPLTTLAMLRTLSSLPTDRLLMIAGAAALLALTLVVAWAALVGPHLPAPIDLTTKNTKGTKRKSNFSGQPSRGIAGSASLTET